MEDATLTRQSSRERVQWNGTGGGPKRYWAMGREDTIEVNGTNPAAPQVKISSVGFAAQGINYLDES